MVLGAATALSGDVQEGEQLLLAAVKKADAVGYAWAAGSSLWILANVKIALGQGSIALGHLSGALARIPVEEDLDLTSVLAVGYSTAAALAAIGRGDDAADLAAAVTRHGTRLGYLPQRMDPRLGALGEALISAVTTEESRAAAAQRAVGLGWSEMVADMRRAHALAKEFLPA